MLQDILELVDSITIHYVTMMSYGFNVSHFPFHRVTWWLMALKFLFIFMYINFWFIKYFFSEKLTLSNWTVPIAYFFDSIKEPIQLNLALQDRKTPCKTYYQMKYYTNTNHYNTVAGNESRISSWLYLCFG